MDHRRHHPRHPDSRGPAPHRGLPPGRPTHRWGLLGALVCSLLVAACSATPSEPDRATVARIIDGDTIVVTMASGTERVRLLNMDTPETVHPTEPVECFGPEASAAIAEMIPPGTELRMVRDIEARDTFGRLLAHVHRAHDDLFVNLEMVRLGYAEVLVIAPNDTHADQFRAAQAEAREHRRGLWGACG